jgi:hypothetical protein
VPRPEIVGNDLRDLIYVIRRGTLQGSLGEMLMVRAGSPGPPRRVSATLLLD